ncbi:hypothetical protein [Chelonobacter oris]
MHTLRIIKSELLKAAFSGECFQQYFVGHYQYKKIEGFVLNILL